VLKIVDNQMGVDKRRRGKKEEKKKERTHKIGEEEKWAGWVTACSEDSEVKRIN
jgi:hypothetical protein